MVNKPIILCTSRFGKRKGVEDLIKAMKQVLKTVPKARLVLAGTGEQKNKLKPTKNIRYLGRVSRQKMPNIYRQTSIFVLPSLSESMSNSLLEAMASGLPVVATKVGGNPELVTKQNGILVPPADCEDLAKAIIRLLQNKELGIKMGKNSLAEAKKHNWQKTAKKYFRLYAEMVK